MKRLAIFMAAALIGTLAGLGTTTQTAFANGLISQMWCDGSYGSDRIRGLVQADMPRAPAALDPSAYVPFLAEGDMEQIPGRVRLLGHFQDISGNLLNFEVTVGGTRDGTGSIWRNGARDDETALQVVVSAGGFTLYSEDGDATEFACTV